MDEYFRRSQYRRTQWSTLKMILIIIFATIAFFLVSLASGIGSALSINILLKQDLSHRGELWKQSPYVNLCKSSSDRETISSCHEAGFDYDEKNCKCKHDTRFQLRESGNYPLSSSANYDPHCMLRLATVEIPYEHNGNSNRIRHPSVITGLVCAPSDNSFDNGANVCGPKETFNRSEKVQVFEDGFHIGTETVIITFPRSCQRTSKDAKDPVVCLKDCVDDSQCKVKVIESCDFNYFWNETACECQCNKTARCQTSEKFNENLCICEAVVDRIQSKPSFSLEDCSRLVLCADGIAAVPKWNPDGSSICFCPPPHPPQPTTSTTSTPSITVMATNEELNDYLWPIVVSSRYRTTKTFTYDRQHATSTRLASTTLEITTPTTTTTTTAPISVTTTIPMSSTATSSAEWTTSTLTTLLFSGLVSVIGPKWKSFTSSSPPTIPSERINMKTVYQTEEIIEKPFAEQLCMIAEEPRCELGFERFFDRFTNRCICSCLGIDIYPRWICRKLMFWHDRNID